MPQGLGLAMHGHEILPRVLKAGLGASLVWVESENLSPVRQFAAGRLISKGDGQFAPIARQARLFQPLGQCLGPVLPA